MDRLLMVFVKNAVAGKVKTRLARDIGDEMALAVYEKLLVKTSREIGNGSYHRWVFYSDFIDLKSPFSEHSEGKVQNGSGLGERMENAFEVGFKAGYSEIVIIGSDCFELSSDIVSSAFMHLKKNDVVIGPARDGGYYLLGLKKFTPSLFRRKSWSTDKVFDETMHTIRQQNLSCFELPVLTDIDTLEDLQRFPELLG